MSLVGYGLFQDHIYFWRRTFNNIENLHQEHFYDTLLQVILSMLIYPVKADNVH